MRGMHKFNEISTLEPKVKLLGTSKAGKIDIDFKDSSQNFDDSTTTLSFIQTPHIIEIGKRFSNELGKLEYISFEYDKFKLFDVPDEDKIITFITTKDTNNEYIISTVSKHILNLETKEKQNYEVKSTKDISNNSNSNNKDNNLIQDFILNYIQYIKEFTIASIQMNEKNLKSFWKRFNI